MATDINPQALLEVIIRLQKKDISRTEENIRKEYEVYKQEKSKKKGKK